jgi:Fe2+ or Zn2+ uptake regulation protein
MATARRSKAKSPVSHADIIETALKAAAEVVNDSSIGELEWPVVLRTKLSNCSTPFSDSDLRRYLRASKLQRDGRKDWVRPGSEVTIREDEWLLRGVIMRHATNMIFALPKCGKTRFILAMLGEFAKGRGEFAGVPLHPGKEKLLLLGPDQSETSWGGYLQKVDLVSQDKILSDKIVGMTVAETNFVLDEYWFTHIEQELREHGPLIVVLDSYSAAIRALGLDENKPEAATPLMKLHNLVQAYGSTLIVIHHANKGGGDGNASKASRGSTAITATVDNLISMQEWKGEQEDGVKKYELHVEGRAETSGTPLIGFSKHSNEWKSFGSVSDAKAELRKDDTYDRLTPSQLQVLSHFVEATTERNEPMTTKEVATAIYNTPNKIQLVTAAKHIKRLRELGFLEQVGSVTKGSQNKENQFRPTGWAVAKHSIHF